MSARRQCFALVTLGTLMLTLTSGCGGVGNFLAVYELIPNSATLNINTSADFAATTTASGVDSYAFSVREAGGGTVTQGTGSNSSTFTYTAPNTPGTYHVDVTYFDGPNNVAGRTFTVTVVP